MPDEGNWVTTTSALPPEAIVSNEYRRLSLALARLMWKYDRKSIKVEMEWLPDGVEKLYN